MSAYTEAERHRIHDIQEYGVDIKHFMIYVQGVEEYPDPDLLEPGVEYRMANRFIKNLDILTGIDADRPITISQKTNGGDWTEGMAMHDAILATPNPVSILNSTHARSMSSLFFQAANKRIMMPHSTFMFHEGTFGVDGTWKQVNTEMAFAQYADQQMMEVYIDAMKRSPHGKAKSWSRKRIHEWLKEQMNNKEEVYMLPAEAIKWGFADEMFLEWDFVTQYTPEQLHRK